MGGIFGYFPKKSIHLFPVPEFIHLGNWCDFHVAVRLNLRPHSNAGQTELYFKQVFIKMMPFARHRNKHNMHTRQWEDNCLWLKSQAQPKTGKHWDANSWTNRKGDTFGWAKGGLNFTRFADSRKGGGNAMREGGGGRKREWGILTFTYRQQAEQSRAEVSSQSVMDIFFFKTTHPHFWAAW